MTALTQPTLDMLGDDFVWMKEYTAPEHTAPLLKRFVDQGMILLGQQGKCALLMDGDPLVDSPETGITHLAPKLQVTLADGRDRSTASVLRSTSEFSCCRRR